ncbi:MAG: hypothetical protein Q9218_007557 [Villophora microphyllina]
MADSGLKRKAERDAPSDKPAKRILTKQQGILAGSTVGISQSPKRKREDHNVLPDKKHKPALYQPPEQTQQRQAPPPVVRPPPRPQQSAPKPQGASFFQLIQKKGKTTLPSKLDPIKAQWVKCLAATNGQGAPVTAKIHVPNTKPAVAKAQDSSSSKYNGLAGVPNGKSTPPAVSSASTSQAVGAIRREEATKHVSPTETKVEESMKVLAKKTKTESPSLATSVAPSVTVGTPVLEGKAKEASPTLPEKRKAEGDTEEPAKKKAKVDPMLGVFGMVNVNGQLERKARPAAKPAPKTETNTVLSGDRARNTKASSTKSTPPAGLDNDENRCYGNVVMHVLDSVLELRDHLVSRSQEAQTACEEQSPVAERDGEAVELDKRKKAQEAFQERTESLRVYVGRHLEKMATAAKEGKTTTIQPLLQAFAKRDKSNADYDGSKQQETYDFLERLLQQLGEEERESGGDKQKIPFVTDLFAGKTVTQMECKACGNKREASAVDACSLQLKVPKGKPVGLESCLEQAFTEEKPEGYACEACGKKDTTSKKDVVKEWGLYLVLNCDRASPKLKIGTKISIPAHVDLAKHMADYKPLAADATVLQKANEKLTSPHRFEVIAFAEHKGTRTNAGHYTAHRKVGSEWFFCDDEKVSRSTPANLKETKATLVLLRRD